VKPNLNVLVALSALLLFLAEPAMAQSIDMSPLTAMLQGIIDAATGPFGIALATVVLIGLFIAWQLAWVDLKQALWILIGIAGVASAPVIVAAIWA